MGKKKSRDTYTSKGQRPNVNKKVRNLKKKDDSYLDKAVRQSEAFFKGQPTGYVTIPNPNKNETNKRFIKVKYQDYYHKGQDYKQASRGFIVGVKNDG